MSVEYNLYRKEVINFLHSTSIKFTWFADIMAKQLEIQKGIKVTTESENPYYLNLNGQYSPLDTQMFVTSVDDSDYGTKILFNKNLKNTHPKTTLLYKIPNPEYYILCQTYPTQIGLIKSITYPAKNMDTVLNASNFSLIGYDSSLLHANERENLVVTTQDTLNYIYYRWYIADYSYEDMIPLVFMSLIYNSLTQALLSQRIKNIKTNYVHPMHIWDYLISKGLQDYRDILTDKQSLFLYRNINYILGNKGKRSTLEIMAKNLLTEIHVSLVGKTILQESGEKFDECVHVPEFLSEDVVRIGSSEQYEETITESMHQILERIHDEGYYPNLSIADSTKKEELFGLSKTNILPTRLMELQKAIMYNPYERLMIRFLLDTFMYNLKNNKLNYKIKYVDKNVNLKMELTVQQVIVLWHYTHYKALGLEITEPPTIAYVANVYKPVRPTLDSLPKTITVEGITHQIHTLVDVETLLMDIPFGNAKFKTFSSFQQMCSKQLDVLVKHINDLRINGNLLYHTAMNLLYKSFMINQNLNITLMSASQYSGFINNNEKIKELLDKYLALNIDEDPYRLLSNYLFDLLFPTDNDYFSKYTAYSKDYTKIYSGLKKLFIQLCSYRLTFLETDRSSITFITPPPMVLATLTDTMEDKNVLSAFELDYYTKDTSYLFTNLDLCDDIWLTKMISLPSDVVNVPEGVDYLFRSEESGDIIKNNPLVLESTTIEQDVITPIACGTYEFCMDTFVE